LRNPHNISFAEDDQGNVHLIAAGMGRDNFDEINLIVSGGNYGWSDREGPLVHLTQGGGTVAGVEALPADDAVNNFIYPAAFVGHSGAVGDGFGGHALTGAFVINNGSEFDGQYITGNFAEPGRFRQVDFDELLAADTVVENGEVVSDALSWAEIGEIQIYLDHDNDPASAPIAYDQFTNMIGANRADFRFGEGPDGELIISSKRTADVFVAVNTLPIDDPQYQSTSFDDFAFV